jgi:hypothetical protein
LMDEPRRPCEMWSGESQVKGMNDRTQVVVLALKHGLAKLEYHQPCCGVCVKV